jgi:hypothetical protein
LVESRQINAMGEDRAIKDEAVLTVFKADGCRGSWK